MGALPFTVIESYTPCWCSFHQQAMGALPFTVIESFTPCWCSFHQQAMGALPFTVIETAFTCSKKPLLPSFAITLKCHLALVIEAETLFVSRNFGSKKVAVKSAPPPTDPSVRRGNAQINNLKYLTFIKSYYLWI